MADSEWTHEELDAWLAEEYLGDQPIPEDGLLHRLPEDIQGQMQVHRHAPDRPTELPEPLQLLATAWLEPPEPGPDWDTILHTSGYFTPPITEPEVKWSTLSLEAKAALRWAYETYVAPPEPEPGPANAWPDETPTETLDETPTETLDEAPAATPTSPLPGGFPLWIGLGIVTVVIGGFVVLQPFDTESGEPLGLETTDDGPAPEGDDEVADAGSSASDDGVLYLADVVIEQLDLAGADGVVTVTFVPEEDCGLTGGGDPVFVTGPFDGGPQTSEEGGLFNVDVEFIGDDGAVHTVTGGMWPDGDGGLVFDDRKLGSELGQDITDIAVGPGSIEGTLVWGAPGGCVTTGQLTLGVTEATSTWVASLPPRGPAPGVLQDFSASANGNSVDLSGTLTLPDGTPSSGATLVTTVNDARQEVTTAEDGSFSVRFEDTAESYISAVHQTVWSLVVDTSKYFSD